MQKFSYQLYSSRNFGPVPQTFRMLADLGYGCVEGYGALFENPQAIPELQAALSETGLHMPSTHIGLDRLRDDLAEVIDTAQALGISQIYAPFLEPGERPDDATGWHALGLELAALSNSLRDSGIVLGWHNHDFEFTDLGGETPLEILLGACRDLRLECDVAWIMRANRDPSEWIARFGERITAAHLKDIAAPGTKLDEDGWADLGRGTLDWPALYAALTVAGCDLFVLEHDNPSDDRRFAETSLQAARNLAKGLHR